jgi:GTPase SAR1 family protein
MGSTFFRGSEGCVIVYDVTNVESFRHLDHWLSYFLNQLGLAEPEFPILVLGNKIDDEAARQVTKDQASEWASERNLIYYETSAKDNINVEQAFKELAREAVQSSSHHNDDFLSQQSHAETVDLGKTPPNVGSTCCLK